MTFFFPLTLDGQNEADAAAIKEAIRSATSLEEIERLNQMLKSGQIPTTLKDTDAEENENIGGMYL